VCGRGSLKGYNAQYFINPNEVLEASSGYGFSLSDARSICLKDCPPLLPADSLSWVCEYPSDVPAANWASNSSAPRTLSDWSSLNYNYFSQLSTGAQRSSCALSGPCYPVVTQQANVWSTCQTQTLTNLPLSTGKVSGLESCISCCQLPFANKTAACNATDVNGLATVMAWTGNTGTNASANDQIGCLASCETMHGTISSFAAATTGSISPTALFYLNSTCAGLGGAATVPPQGLSDGGAMAAVVGSLAASYKATALRYAADMLTSWKALVVCGLLLPFVFSFLWLSLMRVLTGPLVWATLLCVDLATLGVTLFCFSKAGAIGHNSFSGVVSYDSSAGFRFNAAAADSSFAQLTTVPPSTTPLYDTTHISKTQMYYLGIASAILTVCTWLLSVFLIPRLKVAIATIRVACHSLQLVPSLVLFPLFPGLLLAGYMVFFVALGLFIYSSGTIVKRDCCAEVQSSFGKLFPSYVAVNGNLTCASIHCGYEVKMDKALQYTLIYHGFEFLWTTNLLAAFSLLTVAQVVHKCYLHAGGEGLALPAWPVAAAAKSTLRYYMGSLALGSLVCAVFQMFRYVVAYASLKLKKLAERQGVVRVLLWLSNCLLYALERLVELLCNAAYVVVAIDGTSFCASAAHATSLLAANAARFAVLSWCSEMILFLGKLGTAASCAVFMFIWLDGKTFHNGAISSPIVPVIVVFLTAFAMAAIVFSVLEQAIQGTILCLVDDEDRNGGRARFAPPALLEATGVAETFKEEQKVRLSHEYATAALTPRLHP